MENDSKDYKKLKSGLLELYNEFAVDDINKKVT